MAKKRGTEVGGSIKAGVLIAILSVALVIASILFLQRGPPSDRVISVVSWGGTTQDALRTAVFKPFADTTGIQTKESSYNGELELIRDMVDRRKVTWDVVHVEDDMMFKAAAEGWLERLPAGMPQDASLRKLSGGYGVPVFAWGTVLAWNSQRLQASGLPVPTAWSALWNPQYQGPFGMRKSPIGTIEIALLGNGYTPANVYPLTREKIVKALGYLSKIRSKISWWSGGAEHQQKLLTEYMLGAAWSGRVWVMLNTGEKVDMTLNQSLLRYDWWVVPRGTPRQRAAFRFLTFASQPNVQAAFCNLTGYGPGTRAALPLLNDRVKPYAPVVGGSGSALTLDGKWWADNIKWVQELWVPWLGQ